MMTTDVEESDIDEHEEPGPSKRQRIIESSENVKSSAENSEAPQQLQSLVEEGNDQEDRTARKRLQVWQACQVLAGFIDNTLNRIIEYFPMSSDSHTRMDPRYTQFLLNQLEATAIAMTLDNISLSRTSDLIQTVSLFKRIMNNPRNSENIRIPVPTILSSFNNSEAANTNTEGDGLNESDRRQNFLDRAVAEAIKKKGLSTLNVDYG